MWNYESQFYGKWLRVLICGYIRAEKNYESLRKYTPAQEFLKLAF
jgi:FAD synthase